MRCLRVPKSEGEEVRQKLLDAGAVDKDRRIETTEDHIFIPLVGEKALPQDIDYPVVQKETEVRESCERDYKQIADIPDEIRQELPSSYDIVGDIAMIKVPESLEGYEEEIGEAILETHPQINTVLRDEGVEGIHRVREVSYMAGEEKTLTVYREYGAEFETDVAQVYFSPRLATERWRVVNCVGKRERIFDMFAGVGPYTILIAKHEDVELVHSVDINPSAVELLRKNVRRNDVEEQVKIYEADAREVSSSLEVDRIIMNLPHSAKDYMDSALKALDEGVIHHYEILPKKSIEERVEELLEECESAGYRAFLKNKREVRTYSATEVHMAFDLEVKR